MILHPVVGRATKNPFGYSAWLKNERSTAGFRMIGRLRISAKSGLALYGVALVLYESIALFYDKTQF